MKKKIIIVDDEPLILDLLKELIEQEEDFEILEIATRQQDFLNSIEQDSFDVAIIDISVGERDGGLNLLQILKNKRIQFPSIMLSAHSEIDYGLKCLQAGAKGYVNKGYICSSLMQGLKEVCDGKLYVAGESGPYIVDQFERLNSCSSPN